MQPVTAESNSVVESPLFGTFHTVPSPGAGEVLVPSGVGDDVPCSPGLSEVRYRHEIGVKDALCPLTHSSLSLDERLSTIALSTDPGNALASPVLCDVKGANVPRAGPGLHLPSFELLGIATPHPDRAFKYSFPHAVQPTPSTDILLAPQGNISLPPTSPRSAINFASQPAAGMEVMSDPRRSLLAPGQSAVDILTPPAEPGDGEWLRCSDVNNAAAHLPGTDPNDAPGAPGMSTSIRPEQVSVSLPAATGPRSDSVVTGPQHATNQTGAPRWVQPALQRILRSLREAPIPSDEALRVLSHALPSPSQHGHIYTRLINDLCTTPTIERTEWINVLHAIPGEYNLQKLPPTSPPTTPGPTIGGDDYFTKKVFDNAVSILDYQSDLSVQMPSQNRAVASPSSIHVSIVERYIPPTNSNEFQEMFNPEGPSILVDRLVELSPNNGTLIFIYPNRTGAGTFYNEYLEPIKAPTLRSFANRYNGPMTIGEQLEEVDKAVARQLPDHTQFAASMRALCAALTAASPRMRSFRHRPATFTVIHEETATVTPDLTSWFGDWWSKQEKGKLRIYMRDFARAVAHQRSNPHIGHPPTETVLVQQLLSDMKQKAERLPPPPVGIEVSVFVIERTAPSVG